MNAPITTDATPTSAAEQNIAKVIAHLRALEARQRDRTDTLSEARAQISSLELKNQRLKAEVQHLESQLDRMRVLLGPQAG